MHPRLQPLHHLQLLDHNILALNLRRQRQPLPRIFIQPHPIHPLGRVYRRHLPDLAAELVQPSQDLFPRYVRIRPFVPPFLFLFLPIPIPIPIKINDPPQPIKRIRRRPKQHNRLIRLPTPQEPRQSLRARPNPQYQHPRRQRIQRPAMAELDVLLVLLVPSSGREAGELIGDEWREEG